MCLLSSKDVAYPQKNKQKKQPRKLSPARPLFNKMQGNHPLCPHSTHYPHFVKHFLSHFRTTHPPTAQHGPPLRPTALFLVCQHGRNHPRYGRKMVANPAGLTTPGARGNATILSIVQSPAPQYLVLNHILSSVIPKAVFRAPSDLTGTPFSFALFVLLPGLSPTTK